MTDGSTQASHDAHLDFVLVRDDASMRLQRLFKLAPRGGLGVGRRAVFFALFTWLPIAAWALWQGHAFANDAGEPLLGHYGVQVLCLIAIPVLILCEGVASTITRRIVPQFVTSGLVTAVQRERFAAVLRSVAKLRDASLPWMLVVGAVIATLLFSRGDLENDSVSWSRDAGGGIGFGGWWFLYVARPIYVALVFGWVWRLVLLTLMFARVAQLDLAWVPTHPDRAGGVGFVEDLPGALVLWIFAVASVAASRWAHELLYHGANIADFKLPLAALAVVLVLLVLAPLLAFAGPLMRARRYALRDYAELVGEHNRLVHRRWIAKQPVDDAAALNAPELGPVADTAALYTSVERMRTVPVGRRSFAAVLLPLAIPMLLAASTQVPIKHLLVKMLRTLI